ncbi:hypothetical protein F5148DRAFT_1157342 [Russula earlei]|uniref:Uncharacterized protein n=1 Tax=Russula earlei TaxID=71964 RepID=A0ACC0UP40_9AGAM|nr:hypothetical protein F5148DRAFT_1157342 [Russula earlei]
MNNPKPENVCAICKKVFSRKADCNRHRKLHDGIKPYPCTVAGCGKRFAQYTALKTHQNVHTRSKPFKCGSCNAAFGDPSSCARHRREIHHPRKPFRCFVEGCTSSILRSSSFKIHLKKHGLNPSNYPDLSKRDQSPVEISRSAEPEGIREGQVSGVHDPSVNQENPFLGPPDSWDPLLSSIDPCKPVI